MDMYITYYRYILVILHITRKGVSICMYVCILHIVGRYEVNQEAFTKSKEVLLIKSYFNISEIH